MLFRSVSLLLDLSGSMSGKNMLHALMILVSFIEVLEAIEVDYSVLGFSEAVYFFKEFANGI